jgi:hypothetical protein
MDGEPRNAAVDLVAPFLRHLNDRDVFVNEGLSLVTADFVRYDERRLTAQPIASGRGWVDAVIDLARVAGEWPRCELTEIVAVRGDRLCAAHWSARFGGGAEIELITVVRVDETCQRFQALYYFDPEDRDRAIARLDELHAELEG